MESFYKFASDSPFLTFFLALIVAEMLIGIAKALRGIK